MRTSLKNLVKVVEQIQLEKKSIDKRDAEFLTLNKAQLELLAEIVSYVKTYDWLKKADYRVKIKDYWNSKFNLESLADRYELSYAAAKMTVSYANQKLNEKLGTNIFDLILEGKIEEARRQFYVSSGKIDRKDLFLDDVLAVLPKSSEKPVDLMDCEKEIKFLHDYSIAEMQKRFSELNQGNLKYLLYVAEGKSTRHTADFNEYIKLWQGQVDYELYMEQQKENLI